MSKKAKEHTPRPALVAGFVPIEMKRAIMQMVEEQERSESYIVYQLLQESPSVKRKIKELATV